MHTTARHASQTLRYILSVARQRRFFVFYVITANTEMNLHGHKVLHAMSHAKSACKSDV